MTIEEMRALASADGDTGRETLSVYLWKSRYEILALVEAANPNNFGGESEWHAALFSALDAFSAKAAEA